MQGLRRLLAFTCVLSGPWIGCVGDDTSRSHLISEPRILAVLAEPAEAAPGATVHYRALVVDTTGPLDSVPLHWSYCLTPRALTENTAVSQRCAADDERPIAERTLELEALMPRDACARFGSETTLGRRPLDPDHSGGYYQPLRLSAPGMVTSVLRQRISCPLAEAPIEVAQRFAQSYRPNEAPAISALSLRVADDQLSDALPAHTAVELTVTLEDAAKERYPLYSALSGKLSSQRESLSAQWFITHGELLRDQSEIPDLSASNVLTTPEPGATLWLWVVVRDDRGGVAVLERRLSVAR